jgi:hypothetical protein
MQLRRALIHAGRTFGETVLGKRRFRAAKERALLAPIEYQRLCTMRRNHTVLVDQPLILISQLQRSGGTLLSQLFDAHPEVHAHPHELYIGSPDKYTWPRLSLTDPPDVWFETLYEGPAARAGVRGYKKVTEKFRDETEALPFVFLPLLQRQLFRDRVTAHPPASQRDVFDAYMTSYFNAWLDNHSLYQQPKKAITAFVPGMSSDAENLDGFFEAYPDGHLISIVRDPRGWFASARNHGPEGWRDVHTAMASWVGSTTAIREAHARHASKVVILVFEDLVSDTEGTMRTLCDRLGLSWSPTLLVPTFNGLPIKADSSYRVARPGIVSEAATRYKQVLADDERRPIEVNALPLYQEVVGLAVRPG